MTLDTRSLLLTFDEQYARPGLIALQTALANCDFLVHVTVASVGLSTETAVRLRSAADALGHGVSIVEAEPMVEGLPGGLPRFTPAAWARIFVDRIVPDGIDRVVYLDADTFCRGPIDELFDLDMAGAPLAAVPDPWEPTHRERGEEFWSAADSPPSVGYFNTGVMVIDTAEWTAADVTRRALNVIGEGRVPTRSVDQDVLNAVLWDDWLPLPATWNTHHLDGNEGARIVHFIGDEKPWHESTPNTAFVEEYRIEARRLGWAL